MNEWNQLKAPDPPPGHPPLSTCYLSLWVDHHHQLLEGEGGEEEDFQGVEERASWNAGRPLDSLSACAILSSKCLLPPCRNEWSTSSLSLNTPLRTVMCLRLTCRKTKKHTVKSIDNNTPYSGEYACHIDSNIHILRLMWHSINSPLPSPSFFYL